MGLMSPEYFNTCATAAFFSVPNNVRGNQAAFNGNAYVGINTYGATNYREYIQTQLISPLVAGQTYYVSFFVSCADKFKYASNNMGAFFSIEQLAGNGAQPINVTPHVLNTNVISDTVGWTQISGTYVASGNEQYITIGNFSNDASTTVSIVYPLGDNFGFYFVDFVYVSTSPLANNIFDKQKISIYPNPTTGQFSLQLNQNEIVNKVELYSQYNKIRDFINKDNIYEIEDLPTGVYYLSVSFESNRKEVTKIIKL